MAEHDDTTTIKTTSRREAHWRAEDIEFDRIALDRVRTDENLFNLAACASFIESGSDLYTHNLVAYFDGDDEVQGWLRDQWEPEELQHGRALAAYVWRVWPEFDWDAAFRSFLGEYATYCKVELLGPTRAQEMASRCVVETGTATYYRALARSSDEPVFRQLCTHIADDEVNHYKHFFRFFRRYKAQEGIGRARVLATLGRRTLELKSEDADCAIRHVLRFRHPERADDAAYVQQQSARMSRTVRTNLSADNTLKMLARPLELPANLQAMLLFPVGQFMNRVFLR